MPENCNVEVSIVANGQSLPEYRIEHEGIRTVKCYVPSETGKNFGIRIHDKGGFKGRDVVVNGNVTMDGIDLTTNLFIKPDTDASICIVEGVRATARASALSRFQFANLQVTDDGESSQDAEHLGSIRVIVDWVRLTSQALPSWDPRVGLENVAVHEKSKKMTTHRVLLSDPVLRHDVVSTNYFNTIILREYGSLEFLFNYANKDLLIARGIAPNPRPSESTQPAVSDDRKVNSRKRRHEPDAPSSKEEGLTAEEEATFRRLQAKISRIEDQRLGRVKTEVKAEVKLEHIPRLTNGIIDLTGDD